MKQTMRLKYWILFILLCGGVAGRAAQPIDDASLRMPAPGDYSLHVLSPTWLELTAIDAPAAEATPLDLAATFKPDMFRVEIDGKSAAVQQLGFKRRAL